MEDNLKVVDTLDPGQWPLMQKCIVANEERRTTFYMFRYRGSG